MTTTHRNSSPGPIALRARYVFPVAGPPIPGGVVVVDRGRIAAVVADPRETAVRPITDLGGAAILPAFVNAHTHLEFSDLAEPLGPAARGFAAWIRSVVENRRSRQQDTEVHRSEKISIDARRRAVESGLAESAHHGAATLGEIATPGWPREPFEGSPLSGTVFLELLTLDPQRVDSLMAMAAEHLDCGMFTSGCWRAGLSPHAPYSVHLDLLHRVVALASERDVPLAMHLGESLDELELLSSHSGPLVQLLRELDFWNASAVPRGIGPTDYVRILSAAPRVLVVHGTFLDAEAHGILAQHADTMSVVYCPRTHARLVGGNYPLAEMVERGVPVAIGTDSRASNPDLSMFEEFRWLAGRDTGLSPAALLELSTLAGARALGYAKETGSLEVGKRADLAVIRLPEREADDPHELLLDDEAAIMATMCGGAAVSGNLR